MVKQTRERTGCWTCRSRKKKCDGRQPTCRNCEVRDIECKGYRLQLVWEDEHRRHGMRRRGPRRRGGASSPDIIIETGRGTLQARLNAPVISSQVLHLTPPPFIHPFRISPTQHLLFDHYISRFVPTYFSCRNSDMPFLSMIIPLAMNNSTVLWALLALSGIQAGREGSPEIKLETLRAKQATLNGCNRLLEALQRQHTQSPSQKPARNFQLQPSYGEDILMLLASALLLILYEQVTDATYSSLHSHLRFVHWLCSILNRYSCAVSGPTAPYYSFLRSIFLYDDLIASTSARRPPLAGEVEYGPMMSGSVTLEASSKYYLPTILTRISKGDEAVEVEDIDRWDGRMDWLPSFFAMTGDSDARIERDDEAYRISEVYRASSKVFYYQICRRRLETGADDEAKTQAAISALTTSTIAMVRDLPDESQYQGALLWPIGIVAREVGHEDFTMQRCILVILERLERRYGMSHFSRYRKSLVARWSRTYSYSNDRGGREAAEGCMVDDMEGIILLG